MRDVSLPLPELALIGGTRAALGAGLGLLLADRLTESQRRAIGWTLLLIGAISTIPLALDILGKLQAPNSTRRRGPAEAWERLTRDGASTRA